MASDILGLLAGGLPSEADYLGQDPFYNAGRGIAQIQVAPRTNAEAIWGPALQGLLSGTLAGYGRRQANESMFDDTRNSPLMKSALASPATLESTPSLRAYLEEDAPDTWSPKQARTDQLYSLLAAQTIQEEARKKAEIRDALNLEVQKLTDPRIVAAKAIPGETQTISDLDQSLKFVDSVVETAKAQNDKGKAALGAVGQFFGVPNSEKATLDAVGESMIGQVDKILGRETNSDARTRLINQFGPKYYDTDAEIERKGTAFKDYLKSLSKATPTIDSLTPTSNPTDAPPTPPAGYELTGNKNANGDWGIRKVR